MVQLRALLAEREQQLVDSGGALARLDARVADLTAQFTDQLGELAEAGQYMQEQEAALVQQVCVWGGLALPGAAAAGEGRAACCVSAA